MVNSNATMVENATTDNNGMVIVMYPSASATKDESGRSSFVANGAVTVIAEGHRTVMIELRDHFKDGRCILSPDSVPHLKLSLKDDQSFGDGMERNAEQPADGKTPKALQPPH